VSDNRGPQQRIERIVVRQRERRLHDVAADHVHHQVTHVRRVPTLLAPHGRLQRDANHTRGRAWRQVRRDRLDEQLHERARVRVAHRPRHVVPAERLEPAEHAAQHVEQQRRRHAHAHARRGALRCVHVGRLRAPLVLLPPHAAAAATTTTAAAAATTTTSINVEPSRYAQQRAHDVCARRVRDEL
jgi:hypothetical protein